MSESLSERARKHLQSLLDSDFNEACDLAETRGEFKDWCEEIDEIADAHSIDIWGDGRKAVEVGLLWWDARCPDCGSDDSKRGDHPCPFPGGDPS